MSVDLERVNIAGKVDKYWILDIKRPQLRSIYMLLVPKAGLEPARISTVDFESTASTDFATSALKGCGNVLDYTCRRRSCKRQRVVIALSVEKQRYPARRQLYRRSGARLPSATLLSQPPQPQHHLPATLSLAPKLHSKSSLFFSHHSHPNHSTHHPNIHSTIPHPTHPHSHIFQKVLINAFLLLTHSAVKY